MGSQQRTIYKRSILRDLARKLTGSPMFEVADRKVFDVA